MSYSSEYMLHWWHGRQNKRRAKRNVNIITCIGLNYSHVVLHSSRKHLILSPFGLYIFSTYILYVHTVYIYFLSFHTTTIDWIIFLKKRNPTRNLYDLIREHCKEFLYLKFHNCNLLQLLNVTTFRDLIIYAYIIFFHKYVETNYGDKFG